jgi:hypothetical protein
VATEVVAVAEEEAVITLIDPRLLELKVKKVLSLKKAKNNITTMVTEACIMALKGSPEKNITHLIDMMELEEEEE